MERKKNLGIITAIIAVFISIIAVTIAYAAYDTSLTIKGSATTKVTKWSIIFKDLGQAQLGNDAGLTSTARQITAPQIVNYTSIETYSVELKTPGDYVAYNFKIKNDGSFPAKISTFSMPTPQCHKGASGIDQDEINVCNNLTYTLTYTTSDGESVPVANRVSAGDSVATNDKYEPGQEREVQLRIYYKSSVTTDQLPTDDVTIDGLNITIPFIQY